VDCRQQDQRISRRQRGKVEAFQAAPLSGHLDRMNPETIYRGDLEAFKGMSLASYRSRKWFQKWGWTFILPAILLFPFRAKDKRTISIVVAAALSAVLPLAAVHC
jgi:hypothetical protein